MFGFRRKFSRPSPFIYAFLTLNRRMNNINVGDESRLIWVLTGSLDALIQNPVLFIPKLISSFLGSLWFVIVIDRLKASKISLEFLLASLISMVALLFLGIFASVIVSAMVDLKEEFRGLQLLKKAMCISSSKILQIILVVLGVVALLLFTYFIAALGLVSYILFENLVLFALASALSFFIVLAFGFYFYFVPVSIVKKNSPIQAIKNSSAVSSENRRDVSVLMLFSLVLLTPALYFTGELETLGYAGFVASRVVSGIVNTYVFTLSPEYYLSAESLD